MSDIRLRLAMMRELNKALGPSGSGGSGGDRPAPTPAPTSVSVVVPPLESAIANGKGPRRHPQQQRRLPFGLRASFFVCTLMLSTVSTLTNRDIESILYRLALGHLSFFFSYKIPFFTNNSDAAVRLLHALKGVISLGPEGQAGAGGGGGGRPPPRPPNIACWRVCLLGRKNKAKKAEKKTGRSGSVTKRLEVTGRGPGGTLSRGEIRRLPRRHRHHSHHNGRRVCAPDSCFRAPGSRSRALGPPTSAEAIGVEMSSDRYVLHQGHDTIHYEYIF
ncbi:hypothetical protein TGAM01_v200227 [Trichoderma gamsii]|uniref:Uncharacterized protein n=1 Tax=Trichoderma gamsii TaxID=398673 RepID=A0A2P5A2N9_9HYPO|nr:hypothetical protein TGAM01_v200227 [Trichoderma gamsii]PON30807.1 hypothetical protein TGAM01_v200227 [Trichoderma gamsii]